MIKLYKGRRVGGQFVVSVWLASENNGAGPTYSHILDPENSRLLHDIARTFSWGDNSPETKQLALAILLEDMGTHLADKFYNDFARDILAELPLDKFQLGTGHILHMLGGWSGPSRSELFALMSDQMVA